MKYVQLPTALMYTSINNSNIFDNYNSKQINYKFTSFVYEYISYLICTYLHIIHTYIIYTYIHKYIYIFPSSICLINVASR